jgi:undecaprenyl-diphosphatase
MTKRQIQLRSSSKSHLFLYALAVLCPIVLLLVFSHAIWDDGRACYLFWKDWRELHPVVTRCVKLVTNWGNPLAYVIYGLIFVQAVRKKNRNDLRFVLCYVIVQLAIVMVLTHVLKNFFGLPRPHADATEPNPWSFMSLYHSFPSGHTTAIVCSVLPLALRWPRPDLAALCALWIAAMGYSRVYLGRHYLMDIWGGIAIGSLAALCVMYFAREKSMSSTPHTLSNPSSPRHGSAPQSR